MPIVIAGSSSERKASHGSSQPARGKPWAGSQPSHTAKTTTSIMPAHTTGTAARACAPTLSAVPSPRPRRIAESTPSGTLNTTAIVRAMMPERHRDLGLLRQLGCHADPVSSDEPRSPRRMPPIQSRYWRGSGWFSPIRSRIASICSGVLFVPAISWATSPGSTRSVRKISTLATSSPSSSRASRVSA